MATDELMYQGQVSVSGCQWRQFQELTEDLQELAVCHQLPKSVLRMLLERGVKPQEIDPFLKPSITTWREKVRLVPGFEQLVDRLYTIVKTKQPLALLGDYDVDGLTSVTQLHTYLTNHQVPTTIYIPNRLVDGYGPNEKAILGFRSEGFETCLMLDCGTGAHKEIQLADDLEMEVLVIDHHCPNEQLPPAAIICNAFRKEAPPEAYPARDLATAGLVFFVLLELAALIDDEPEGKKEIKKTVLPLLDLAALGTICDMVPLLGINRPLVQYGLKQIAHALRSTSDKKLMNLGLKTLLQEKQVAYQTLNAEDLSFQVGPCINAASRLGHVDQALKLLISNDKQDAENRANRLIELNNHRRELEKNLLDEALNHGQKLLVNNPEAPILIISGDDWPIGVIGIVAGRVAESLRRPTIVISWQGTTGVGSGRSIPGVDLGKLVLTALKQGYLTHGGGHEMAIGLRLERSFFPGFQAWCVEQQAKEIEQMKKPRILAVDIYSQLSSLREDLAQNLQILAPYGCGNQAPLIALSRVRICNLRIYSQTLSFALSDGEGNYFSARLFRAINTPLGRTVIEAKNETYHCAGYLKVNSYQGRVQTYFLLKDLMLVK